MAVACKWQACEMWSMPGAAAVDVFPSRSERSGRSGDGQMTESQRRQKGNQNQDGQKS